MAGAMTKTRIQSDILEWHVPEEVLAPINHHLLPKGM
jgi:hypothetical protein